MEVILLMIPISVLLGLSFLALFILSSKNGQYDDLDSPAYKILIDDEIISTKKEDNGK